MAGVAAEEHIGAAIGSDTLPCRIARDMNAEALMKQLGMLIAVLAFALPGAAQQTVPFENGTPIAPAGFEPQPIPAEPIEYDTAEVMGIRVVPIARGLVNPWSVAFLPASLGTGGVTMLVTEKEGRLRIVR